VIIMFIPIAPAKTTVRSQRLLAGRYDHNFRRTVSILLIYSFSLTLTGIPALVSGARLDAWEQHQIQVKRAKQVQLRAILASVRMVLPQITLSDFGKCYATTDSVVRDVAQGAGELRVGETLPGGEAPLSSAAPVRVPGALPEVRGLLQNNRPFIQAVCTVWLPELPATTTLSDRATFAGSQGLRAPGEAVMATPYGPFLGAGANPLSTTLSEVRTLRPVVTARPLDTIERLTADLPRITPQSGVPPGWNGTGVQSSRPISLDPPDPRRSTPDNRFLPRVSPAPSTSGAVGPNVRAARDLPKTSDTAGLSVDALPRTVATAASNIYSKSHRAG
jgi:hypothetical protein